MSGRRRPVGAIVVALVAACLTGCAPGEPPASCGEYTLEQGESIPREAVDCMSAAGEGGGLRVTVPTVEGDPIVTSYWVNDDGSIVATTDATQDRFGGGTTIMLCHHPVSVVDLGECEELHEGD